MIKTFGGAAGILMAFHGGALIERSNIAYRAGEAAGHDAALGLVLTVIASGIIIGQSLASMINRH
jgi:hypothetical protein